MIYPDESHYDNDRILEQLKFVPPQLAAARSRGQEVKLKKIFLQNGVGSWAKVSTGAVTTLMMVGDVRVGLKLGQIGRKWSKSGTF